MLTIETFLDKLKFIEFKNSVSNAEFETEVLSFLQNMENEIARKNNRAPSYVVFEDPTEIQESGAFYNKENEKIAFIRGSFEPVEYIINLVHEAEHANQEYSKNNTDKENTAHQISGWLYPVNNQRQLTIDYTCNYLEILSKVEELKKLLELYNEKKGTIEEYTTGKMFYKAFENNFTHIDSVTPEHGEMVLNSMIKIVRNPFTKIDKSIGLSRREMLKFLKKDMRDLYKEVFDKLAPIKEAYLEIRNELKNDYDLNASLTVARFNDMQNQKLAEQQKMLDNLKDKITVNDSITFDYTKDFDTVHFNNMQKYIEFLQSVNYPIFVMAEDVKENSFSVSFYMEDKENADLFEQLDKVEIAPTEKKNLNEKDSINIEDDFNER